MYSHASENCATLSSSHPSWLFSPFQKCMKSFVMMIIVMKRIRRFCENKYSPLIWRFSPSSAPLVAAENYPARWRVCRLSCMILLLYRRSCYSKNVNVWGEKCLTCVLWNLWTMRQPKLGFLQEEKLLLQLTRKMFLKKTFFALSSEGDVN